MMARRRRSTVALRLLDVLPRWLVIVLTLAAFLLAGGLLLWGILDAKRFEHPLARFCLCAGMSAYFAVFFFVLFPQTVKVTRLPGLPLPPWVKLTGPVALFLILLWLLLEWMPVASPGRFFRAKYSPGADLVHVDLFQLQGESGFHYLPVVNRQKEVIGAYVTFAGDDTKYRALVHIKYGGPDLPQDFERGVGEGAFRMPERRHDP